MDGEWRNGLFDHVCGGDCGTCMGAWFCAPCLYGRTAGRLDMYPNDEKPGCCNGGCWLMCGAACCHLHWLVALFKRGDMRNKFDIKGDGCTDCLASYFCFPCALAQMETEIKDRARLNPPPGGKNGGYSQSQGGMVYQQPAHQQMGVHQGHQGHPGHPGHPGYNQGPPKY